MLFEKSILFWPRLGKMNLGCMPIYTCGGQQFILKRIETGTAWGSTGLGWDDSLPQNRVEPPVVSNVESLVLSRVEPLGSEIDERQALGRYDLARDSGLYQ